MDGMEHRLILNNGPNALHGGALGLHKRIWEVTSKSSNGIELTYTSREGEEGYPGELLVKVSYTLPHGSNELAMTISATTDKRTPVNIAGHR